MSKRGLLAVPAIAVLAGGAWAGTTLYSGSESRSAYDQMLDGLSDQLGLTFVNESYTAGFMASSAVTQIRLSDAPDAKVVARLRHNIEHSPTPGENGISAARVHTRLMVEEFEPDVRGFITDLFNGAHPLVLDSNVALGGSMTHTLTLAPIDHELDSETRITSEMGVWNIDVRDGEHISGQGNWGGAKLQSPDMIISFAASSDVFDYQRVAAAVYRGSYDFLLPEVVISQPMLGMSVAMRDVSVGLSSDVEDGLMSGKYRIAIDDVDAPIALDAVALETTIGGIDISEIERLRSAGNTMTLAAVSGGDPEKAEELAAQYYESVLDLIDPGAYIGYQLELANAGGQSTADATMTFEGDGSTSGTASLTEPEATLGDLLAMLKVDINVDAPADVLALTPAGMFLDPAVVAPWLVVDQNGNVSGSIVLDDLVLSANGEQLPVSLMLGEYLQMSLQELQSL